jgi:hypothetical protein
MKMPTYERRYYLIKKTNDTNDAKEANENKGTSKSTGKGSRSTTFSGSALKSKLKNNEIPD